MNDCIVTAVNLDSGLYQEWRGALNAIRSPFIEYVEDSDKFTNEELMRKVPFWTCRQEDVDLVVEKMSQAWVGCEIKVFNMTQSVIRLPGELKRKVVTKDGVLPE